MKRHIYKLPGGKRIGVNDPEKVKLWDMLAGFKGGYSPKKMRVVNID